MDVIFFLVIFIGLPVLGYYLFTGVFDSITGYSKEGTYIDKSTHVHHHYHDNRSVHLDGNKLTSNRDEPTIDI